MKQILSVNTRVKACLLGLALSTLLLIMDKLNGDQWVMFNMPVFGFFIGGKTADTFALRRKSADPSNI